MFVGFDRRMNPCFLYGRLRQIKMPSRLPSQKPSRFSQEPWSSKMGGLGRLKCRPPWLWEWTWWVPSSHCCSSAGPSKAGACRYSIGHMILILIKSNSELHLRSVYIIQTCDGNMGVATHIYSTHALFIVNDDQCLSWDKKTQTHLISHILLFKFDEVILGHFHRTCYRSSPLWFFCLEMALISLLARDGHSERSGLRGSDRRSVVPYVHGRRELYCSSLVLP
jgi:hypothetical protein